jgi:hypothetical protein
MSKSPEYKTPDENNDAMTYRIKKEDIRSQIKSFEQLKEKHERDTADYNKRREIIRKLLIDYFALPEDVYDFDMDYVIRRIEPHQISMTLQEQNIFESIKISNHDMKKFNKAHIELDDVKTKLNQFEDDERILEVHKHLPKYFPDDIFKYVLAQKISKKKGSKTRKGHKKKGSKTRKGRKHSR